MIGIYGIKIQKDMDKDTFNYLLALISLDKQERIKRFKFFDDAQRSLFGEILIRCVICKKLGIANYQLKFDSNEYGKPIILEPEGFHFNISHSGDWVVCAVDSRPIGIDVEFIKKIDFNLARRFFSKEEYKDLMKKDVRDRTNYFYKLWTLKESYVKAIGKGLSISLKSFSFKIDNMKNIQLYTIHNEFNNFSFWQYQIDKSYVVSLCFQGKDFKKNSLRVIGLSEIISELPENVAN